ncbi:efflux RND transporter periplasmic adaptor subunit [Comamonadaceae bacterium M7527]|nr:efflux RND transporter periplasmic adaptor subunit [Comamonadaceae bacterium M7527]
MKSSKLTGLVAALATGIAALYWLAPTWLPTALQPHSAAAQPGQQGSAGAAGRRSGFGGPTAVSLQEVVIGDVPMSLQAPGSVVAQQSVVLRSQVGATIKRVVAKEGSRVAAGELLFELDARGVQAELAKAQAQLAKSQATLADLQNQLLRAKALKDQAFVSGSAVDSAQSQVGAQMAQVAADQASVRAQQVQLSLYQVRAPFAGRVGAIDVSAGTLVSAGASATPLATLTQFNPIGVKFSLPESALSAVANAGTGREVSVRLASSNPSMDTTSHMGQLTLIDNLVNPATGMLTLKATLANDDNALWPGQFVDVSLSVATLNNVAKIAQGAVAISDQGASVFVMGDNGKAQVKPIRILHTMDDMAVVSGLSSGDKVVVDGRQNVKPGGLLRDINAPATKPTK